MKKSVKMASLAALTAAIIALPAAAGTMPSHGSKCHPKASMHKCGTKCSAKMAKCGAKCSAKMGKCGAKCAPKCGAKCAPKSKCGAHR